MHNIELKITVFKFIRKEQSILRRNLRIRNSGREATEIYIYLVNMYKDINIYCTAKIRSPVP